MSQILELYRELSVSDQRFKDEVFVAEEYALACPKLTILDVGGYEGEFSFYCLNFADKIYAFEPDRRPFLIFEDRIKRFGLKDKIILTNRALGGVSGSEQFHASGYGGSRLLPEGQDKHAPFVTVVSLADFMSEHSIDKIDILKIDIEGGENVVFKAPEFPELSKRIKIIIGEHLEGVDFDLKALGYEATPAGGRNICYVRSETKS